MTAVAWIVQPENPSGPHKIFLLVADDSVDAITKVKRACQLSGGSEAEVSFDETMTAAAADDLASGVLQLAVSRRTVL